MLFWEADSKIQIFIKFKHKHTLLKKKMTKNSNFNVVYYFADIATENQ